MIIKRYNCAGNEIDAIADYVDMFESPQESQAMSEPGWKTYEITIEVKEYVPPSAINLNVSDSLRGDQ